MHKTIFALDPSIKHAILPSRATSGSAGFDLYTPREFSLIPAYNARSNVPFFLDLGVRVAIPRHHVGLLTLRSSIGKRGLIIPNAPGIIDSDYRGNLALLLINLGMSIQHFPRGARLAQLTIVPCNTFHEYRADLPPANSNRTGGLGSTGI